MPATRFAGTPGATSVASTQTLPALSVRSAGPSGPCGTGRNASAWGGRSLTTRAPVPGAAGSGPDLIVAGGTFASPSPRSIRGAAGTTLMLLTARLAILLRAPTSTPSTTTGATNPSAVATPANAPRGI